MSDRRTEIIFLGVLLLAFLAISLSHAAVLPFDGDEVFSFTAASKGFFPMLAFLAKNQTPPLFYLSAALFLKIGSILGGPVELWLRMTSILSALLCIPIFFLLGRLWWQRSEALLATTLLTFSSFLVLFSNFSRFYTLFLLLSLCSYVAIEKSLRSNRRGWIVLFFLITGVGLYLHYFIAFVFLGQSGYFLFQTLRPSTDPSVRRLRMRRFMVGTIGLLLALLPVAYFFLQQSKAILNFQSLSYWVWWRIRVAGSTVALFAGARNHQPLLWLGVPIWGLAIYGYLQLRRAKAQGQFVLCTSGLIAAIVPLLLPTRVLGSRYFIGFFPLFLFCLVSGLSHLMDRVRTSKRVPLMAVMLSTVLAPSLYSIYTFLFVQKGIFEALDSRSFVTQFRETLEGKPMLLTNFRYSFKGGRVSPNPLALAYYLNQEGEIPPGDLVDTDYIEGWLVLKDVLDQGARLPSSSPIVAVIYSEKDATIPPVGEGWEKFDDKLFVRRWPAQTDFDEILQEIKKQDFPLRLSDL